MNHKIKLIGLLLATTIGCDKQRVNIEEEGKKLMQISRDWSKSISPDSIERVMSYWADDAVYMTLER